MATIEGENYRKQYNISRRIKRANAREDREAEESRRNGWTLDNPPLLVTFHEEESFPAGIPLELSPEEAAILAIYKRKARPKASFDVQPEMRLENIDLGLIG